MLPKYCKCTRVLIHAYVYLLSQFIHCLGIQAVGDREFSCESCYFKSVFSKLLLTGKEGSIYFSRFMGLLFILVKIKMDQCLIFVTRYLYIIRNITLFLIYLFKSVLFLLLTCLGQFCVTNFNWLLPFIRQYSNEM